MKLDVIIPTYNRQEMLKRTLSSLLAADLPPELDVRVTVVDNNSKDKTKEVVAEQAPAFKGRLNYVFESRQGRSSALNAGIAATNGDLIGMIDDDEEIDRLWFAQTQTAFQSGEVDFIGGPYLPRWGAQPPGWLPMNYLGVIGWIDGGDKVVPFGPDYPGILMGGNAVLTRSIVNKIGKYNPELSRRGNRLLAGEDEDMYERLLAVGARGLYLPSLIIYHYIPPERLTKRYFRRWCFWRGVSLGVLDRQRRSAAVYLAGVPRWLYGQAGRGVYRLARTPFKRGADAAETFTDELAVWDLAGFFYGKHLYRPSA